MATEDINSRGLLRASLLALWLSARARGHLSSKPYLGEPIGSTVVCASARTRLTSCLRERADLSGFGRHPQPERQASVEELPPPR